MTEALRIRETVHTTRDHRSFRIRRARREDAAAAMRYAEAFFEEPDLPVTYAPGEFSLSVAAEEQFIQSHDAPGALLLLALADQEVIGSLAFQAGKLARTRHAGMFGVGVAREWRGIGVGSALLQRLVAWAREHPEIERIGLEVFSNNPRASKLYRRFGFQQEGRRRGAIRMGARSVDAVQMGLLLPPKRPPASTP